MNPSKTTPALIGGTALGFLSSLPLIGCACCAIAAGGGVLASYLYSKDQTPQSEPPYGDHAVLGVLTGSVGAVVASAIGLVFSLLFGGASALASMVDQLPSDMPPEVADLMGNLAVSGGFSVLTTIVGFVFYLVIFSIFATLGSLLYVAITSRNG